MAKINYQFYCRNKEEAGRALDRIERELPDVRWKSGDLPSEFMPPAYKFPIWLEVNRAGQLGYCAMNDRPKFTNPFYERTLECEDTQDTAPSAAEPIAPATTDDPVDYPSHYTHGSVECIDAMVETQGVHAVQHFCVYNAFKCLWRWRGKNGMEDIKKEAWYLNKAITLQESEEK